MQIVVPDEWKYLYASGHNPKVIKYPDARLRQPSRPIERVTKRVDFLANDLVRIMTKANGVGLAAPQVGVHQRVVVIAPDDLRPTALINPEVVSAEGEQIGQEGCLSVPGLYGDVVRAEKVEIRAYDRRGRELVYELEGMPARVALHEIDHLDGILFTDRADAATLHWHDPDEPVTAVT